MRIDAHQHFWKMERGDYGWLTPDLTRIYRDFAPPDLAPFLTRHGIDGTIVVQAAPTIAETEYMLSLVEEARFIKGVVGWVDFESATAPADIERLAQHPSLVGLRPMIQDIEDVDWMLRDDLTPAFDALKAANLTFDALTLPPHLPNLSQLLARHGDMRTVIDHGSKPYIADGLIGDWATEMAALAAETNAYCKLSGLVTEAAQSWTVNDLRPYVDHLLSTFGPERLIWGSDWPVCTLAATYDRWVEATDALLKDLNENERAAVLGKNAAAAYRLADMA